MTRWTYHIPILGYHRVGPGKGDHVPTVSAQAFERQLSLLARHGYRLISLEEVVEAMEAGQPVPRRSVVITFDDGYEEVYQVAWPMIKRFGFLAIVFVTPAEVGLPGFATWEQLREMAGEGLRIGCHTMHHSYLPLVSDDRLVEEVIDSKRVIEEQIGQTVQFLSYPVGGYTPKAQAVVRQAGYLAACTTNRASRANGADRFALRRIKVTERDRYPLSFLVKLSGYYDLFRRLKEPS